MQERIFSLILYILSFYIFFIILFITNFFILLLFSNFQFYLKSIIHILLSFNPTNQMTILCQWQGLKPSIPDVWVGHASEWAIPATTYFDLSFQSKTHITTAWLCQKFINDPQYNIFATLWGYFKFRWLNNQSIIN